MVKRLKYTGKELLDRMIELLEYCLEKSGYSGGLTDECYEKLRELELIGGYDGILSDLYYDNECIAFTLNVLKKIKHLMDHS